MPIDESSTPDPEQSIAMIGSVDAFDRIVRGADRVLIDIYADWCGPCKMMAPMVEELARETDATVAKVDVDSTPILAERFGVRSVPTFIAFADGEPVERLVGMQDKGALAAALD